MSKGIVLWVWMAVTAVLAGHALADEAADINKANDAAKAPTEQLADSTKNLSQMRGSLPKDDADAVEHILYSEDHFSGVLTETQTVGLIFRYMDCKADVTFAGAIFEKEVRSVVAHAGYAIEAINSALPFVKNPAALAEATRLRDLVTKIRGIYLPFAPDGKD